MILYEPIHLIILKILSDLSPMKMFRYNEEPVSSLSMVNGSMSAGHFPGIAYCLEVMGSDRLFAVVEKPSCNALVGSTRSKKRTTRTYFSPGFACSLKTFIDMEYSPTFGRFSKISENSAGYRIIVSNGKIQAA